MSNLGNKLIPAIPDTDGSTVGNATSLRALKLAIDVISGQRAGGSFGAPMIYVQTTAPSTNHTGDLWINIASNTLNYWDGGTWQAIKGA